MLDNALRMESYYYSTNYDLTHSFQRLYNTSPDFHSMSLLERVSKAHLIYMYFIFYKYLNLHVILNEFIGYSLSVYCKRITFVLHLVVYSIFLLLVQRGFLFSLFLEACKLQSSWISYNPHRLSKCAIKWKILKFKKNNTSISFVCNILF